MKMSQKKFTFNDEDEDTNDIYQSHIDKYDSYYQQTPKTKQINQPHKKTTVPTTKPVSYTHLDVYKRQVKRCS